MIFQCVFEGKTGVLRISLFLTSKEISALLCIFPALVQEPAISLRSPFLFIGNLYQKPKTWMLDVLMILGYHCFQAISVERIREYVSILAYLLAYVHTHAHTHTYIYSHLYLYATKHEFIVMFLTLIHYHMDHSSLFCLLIYKLHSNSEEPGSPHLPSIYLSVQFQQAYIVVSKLLIQVPVGSNFINQSTVLMFSCFCLQSFRLHSFSMLLRSAFPPNPFSEIVLYITNQSSHSMLGSADLLNDFCRFSCILMYYKNHHYKHPHQLTSVSVSKFQQWLSKFTHLSIFQHDTQPCGFTSLMDSRNVIHVQFIQLFLVVVIGMKTVKFFFVGAKNIFTF